MKITSTSDDLPGTATWDAVKRTFEHSRLGVAMIDLSGFIVDCNEAFAAPLGYDKIAIQRRSVHELTRKEDTEDTRARFRELGTGRRRTLSFQKEYQARDGSSRLMNVVVCAICEHDELNRDWETHYLIDACWEVHEESSNAKDELIAIRQMLEQQQNMHEFAKLIASTHAGSIVNVGDHNNASHGSQISNVVNQQAVMVVLIIALAVCMAILAGERLAWNQNGVEVNGTKTEAADE